MVDATDRQGSTAGDADVAVVIAGGGPTGMMLAAELSLAGVDAHIVERRTTQELDGARAGGLLARSIEVLDQRGIVDRFLDAGQPGPMFGFGQTMFSADDLPTRHSYVLALWQSRFEQILAARVAELGVTTRRGCEVIGFVEEADGVDVRLSDGTTLRAQYLVGCDGGRSLVRKAAGIDFPGLAASTSWLIAEGHFDGEPTIGFTHTADGSHAIGRRSAEEPYRVVIQQPAGAGVAPRGIEDLRDALVHVYGTDFGLRTVGWISRFTDATRQAAAYRKGRILLAGDAAHIHPPQGGQGMGTGIQDAVNLGWKLARVVLGTSPPSLLDTYHDERHPVGARVLQLTRAMVALGIQDDQHEALREVFGGLLQLDAARRQVAAMLFALDIRYGSGDDLGDSHPLVGRRMPDLDLDVAGRATRAFELLHDARPVLLCLSGPPQAAARVATGHGVIVVEAGAPPSCELPLLGTVDLPAAVLIRPDGHVAWAGEPTDPTLADACGRWFGSGADGTGRRQTPAR